MSGGVSARLEECDCAASGRVKTPAVVALANDWLAYALMPEQYKRGNYEAGMSFYGETLGPTLLTALDTGLKKGK